MLELADAGGATVVVPVALDAAKGRDQAHVNFAKSAYAGERRRPCQSLVCTAAQKKCPLCERAKNEALARRRRGYFPFEAISNASGNRIYTDAGLVNA